MLALSKKSTNGRTYPCEPADEELPAGPREPAAGQQPARPPHLLIRPIEPTDSEALQYAFAHELSSASRYLRFHAAISRLPDRLVHYLTHVDGIDHVALVAFECGESLPAAGVGVARFVRVAGWPDTAELAVTVVDHAQGHGIGRLLVAALGAAAQERGIRTFNLVVLGSNRRVRDWLLRLGAVGRSSEAGVITFQLPVEALVTSSANSNRSSAA